MGNAAGNSAENLVGNSMGNLAGKSCRKILWENLAGKSFGTEWMGCALEIDEVSS